MVQRVLTQVMSPATLGFGDGPLRAEATHLLAVCEVRDLRILISCIMIRHCSIIMGTI